MSLLYSLPDDDHSSSDLLARSWKNPTFTVRCVQLSGVHWRSAITPPVQTATKTAKEMSKFMANSGRCNAPVG